MVTSRAGSRKGTGELPGLDDCSTTLLDGCDEFPIKPVKKKGDPSVPISQQNRNRHQYLINSGISDLPCIISNKFTNRFLSTGSLHCGMVNIRVLSGRVVTPNNNIFHITDLDIKSLRNLAKSPVVVQAGQASNIPLRDRWSKFFQDKSIGICWVGNNQNLQSSYCTLTAKKHNKADLASPKNKGTK